MIHDLPTGHVELIPEPLRPVAKVVLFTTPADEIFIEPIHLYYRLPGTQEVTAKHQVLVLHATDVIIGI
jgi:hypothetical protein